MEPNMPTPQNINWVGLLAAIAGIFAYLFPQIPPAVRTDILTVITILFPVVIILLHTFINHPANVQKAKAFASVVADRSVAAGRNVMPALIALLLVGAVAGSLMGCVSAPGGGIIGSPALQDSISKIGSFTLADLLQADQIAKSNGDQIGATCYEGLSAFVTQEQTQAGGAASNTVSGAFSAFEQGRTLANGATNLISKAQVQALETACAPLIQDSLNDQAAFLANLASLGHL